MASFNRIVMIGNLTKDPEFKQQLSGQDVCKFSIACNSQFKNRQTGAMVQDVCYIDVNVWGPQADSCRQYLKKGKPVLVEGRLKLETWEFEGQPRRKHSITAERVVFLSFSQSSESTTDDSVLESGSLSGVSVSMAAKKDEDSNFTDFKADVKSNERKTKKKTNDVLGDNVAEIAFKDEPPFEGDLPF